jgi:hypothetical protein
MSSGRALGAGAGELFRGQAAWATIATGGIRIKNPNGSERGGRRNEPELTRLSAYLASRLRAST